MRRICGASSTTSNLPALNDFHLSRRGKRQTECRFIRRTGNREVATMRTGDVLRDAQSQPGSGNARSHGRTAIKTLKNPLLLLRRDRFTAVGDRYRNAVAVRDAHL